MCTVLPSLRLLLQVGAMSADGSISARAIVTTELVSEATELQGLGKVEQHGPSAPRGRLPRLLRARLIAPAGLELPGERPAHWAPRHCLDCA